MHWFLNNAFLYGIGQIVSYPMYIVFYLYVNASHHSIWADGYFECNFIGTYQG